jgi:hypothetical protein
VKATKISTAQWYFPSTHWYFPNRMLLFAYLSETCVNDATFSVWDENFFNQRGDRLRLADRSAINRMRMRLLGREKEIHNVE